MNTFKQTGSQDILPLGTAYLSKLISLLISHRYKSASAVIIGILLFAKWYKDKQITVDYTSTPLNEALVASLKPKLASYNPTFWLFHSVLKAAWVGKHISRYLDMYLRWEYKFHCGSVIGLDIYPRNYASLPDTPVIVLVPGIFGESGD